MDGHKVQEGMCMSSRVASSPPEVAVLLSETHVPGISKDDRDQASIEIICSVTHADDTSARFCDLMQVTRDHGDSVSSAFYVALGSGWTMLEKDAGLDAVFGAFSFSLGHCFRWNWRRQPKARGREMYASNMLA
jgi:hypothetical protein